MIPIKYKELSNYLVELIHLNNYFKGKNKK